MRLKDIFERKPPAVPNVKELLQKLSKRAERLDSKQQADTFVSLGGIERILLNSDNRIIFGRRGTGKTHLLAFVRDDARRKGEVAVTVDFTDPRIEWLSVRRRIPPVAGASDTIAPRFPGGTP